MIRNYFKTAFRNLLRNKAFTTINVLGLALGIATCLLIMLFVTNELSYDRYNKDYQRMYRVVFKGKVQGGELKEAVTMAPVASTLQREFPEVQQATRIHSDDRPPIAYGDKIFRGDQLAFVDSNFFSVFTLPLIKGNPKTVLAEPYSVVITKKLAKKYFGNEDPIGKMIVYKNNGSSMKITGMIDEVPVNSHFHFDLFVSLSTVPKSRAEDWMSSSYYTYLVLPEGYDAKKLEAKLPSIMDKYVSPQLKEKMGVTMAEFRANGNDINFHLQPIKDIHLHSDLTGDMEAYGNITYVYIFSAVAIFMLMIACINFMNLSTAGASKRAKEVGVRKVMGSLKSQLIGQFLSESLLVTGAALVLAVVFVYLALPVFNHLSEQNLRFDIFNSPGTIVLLLGFGLFTGLLAGSYPAFYLSSFNPVQVLKRRFSTGKSGNRLRSGLVVFQFFISIILIVGTAVVYKQLSYIHNTDPGYNKDKVLVIHETYLLDRNQNAFREQLLLDPRIVRVTASAYLPAGGSNSNNFFIYGDNNSSQVTKTLRYEVDEEYIPTLGMKVLAGRNFSKDFGADSSGIIINQVAARTFGWGDSALGHTLTHTENDGSKRVYTVIGIVRDFHFKSLHEIITPLVMTKGTDYGTMIAKINTTDTKSLLNSIEQKWNAFNAGAPFAYSFLDERYNNTYKAEQNIMKILGIFAGLTIFVACLGLFGLVTFTAERRTKEIGIRKVLGADVTGIVSLLSRDFLKLVVLAFVIAIPVAWIVMNKWLEDFAYKVNIGVWEFGLAIVLALFVTILTVSFKAIRAALANPVDSLRSE
jgi:putative ABC transport system permease protein